MAANEPSRSNTKEGASASRTVQKVDLARVGNLDSEAVAAMLGQGDIEIIASRSELTSSTNDWGQTLGSFFGRVARVLAEHGPLTRNKAVIVNILSDRVEAARSDND